MIQNRRVSPHNRGSVKECLISQMEYIEYKQTGMIRVKETPVSRGELRRLSSHRSYYDIVYDNRRNLLDEWDLFIRNL